MWGSHPLDTFLYFKLHGSTNWHYSGRESFFGETIYYSDVTPWGRSNVGSQERQSLSVASDKRVLLIPPVVEKTTYFNNETVRHMWQDASLWFEAATRVFVIGYSLPKSDLGMRFFLARSAPIGGTPIFIIDKDSAVLKRYRGLLKELDQIIKGEFICSQDAVVKFAEAYPTL